MSLTELPEELVSFTAKCLPRNDLLALRQCNKSCAAAVQRSIQNDDRFAKMIFDALAEPRNIEAEGRIFGSGAKEMVSFCAADAALPALQSAITETAGGLQKLCLYRCAVTDARLLEMVRVCPLLQTLVCVIDVPNIETADVEQLAVQISQACPLLEVVKLPCNGSAVEVRASAQNIASTSLVLENDCEISYAAAFPNLRCLEFFSHGHGSHVIPSRFDRIERALHTCAASEVDLDFCVVSPALVEWLLASPLPERLVALRMGRTAISPELILELVRACPALKELALPSLMCLGRPFYEALHAARPTLERISLPHCGNDGDECFRVLASFGSLVELDVASMDALTPAVVDVVLKGRCAASLRSVNLSCVPALGAAEVLKLVKGCPALTTVAWELAGEGGGWGRVTESDEPHLRGVISLLEERGGGLESSESGVGRLLHPGDYSESEDYDDEESDDASGDTTVR